MLSKRRRKTHGRCGYDSDGDTRPGHENRYVSLTQHNLIQQHGPVDGEVRQSLRMATGAGFTAEGEFSGEPGDESVEAPAALLAVPLSWLQGS
jgi:hypothetical protein